MRLCTFLWLLLCAISAIAQPDFGFEDIPYTRFFEDGKVKESLDLTKKDSVWTRRREVYWENGKMKQLEISHEMASGKFHQSAKTWLEDGTMVYEAEIGDVTGSFSRLEKKWYPNGNQQSLMDLSDSGKKTHNSAWYQNGVLARVYNTLDWHLNGEYLQWDSLSNLCIKGNYVNGIRHGTYTEFDSNGNITFKNDYQNGKPISISSRCSNTPASSCEPVRYSDTTCDSVAQLTRKVAEFAVEGDIYRPNKDYRVEKIDSMQLIITRIWNYMRVTRPNSFVTYLSQYRNKLPFTTILVTALGNDVYSFVFTPQDVIGWRVFPSLTLIYYPDGSIELPGNMMRLDMYNASEFDNY